MLTQEQKIRLAKQLHVAWTLALEKILTKQIVTGGPQNGLTLTQAVKQSLREAEDYMRGMIVMMIGLGWGTTDQVLAEVAELRELVIPQINATIEGMANAIEAQQLKPEMQEETPASTRKLPPFPGLILP